MNIPIHRRPYVAAKDYDQLVTMAVKTVEAVYAIDGPFDLKGEMRERVFKEIAWMLTEHDGKYTTRYRSVAALEAQQADVQHEHVFPRRQLYHLSRHGLSFRDVFGYCLGCVVTKEEHSRLSAQDRRPGAAMGWKRYLSAGIQVMDMLENRVVTQAEMEAWTAPYEKAMRNSKFCGDGEVDLELERAERKSLQ
jgi:hypothetical protein